MAIQTVGPNTVETRCFNIDSQAIPDLGTKEHPLLEPDIAKEAKIIIESMRHARETQRSFAIHGVSKQGFDDKFPSEPMRTFGELVTNSLALHGKLPERNSFNFAVVREDTYRGTGQLTPPGHFRIGQLAVVKLETPGLMFTMDDGRQQVTTMGARDIQLVSPEQSPQIFAADSRKQGAHVILAHIIPSYRPVPKY